MKPGTHTLGTGHNRYTVIKSDGGGAKLSQINRGERTDVHLEAAALEALRAVLS